MNSYNAFLGKKKKLYRWLVHFRQGTAREADFENCNKFVRNQEKFWTTVYDGRSNNKPGSDPKAEMSHNKK